MGLRMTGTILSSNWENKYKSENNTKETLTSKNLILTN